MKRKYRKKIKPQHMSMMLGFYSTLLKLGLCSEKNITKATDRIVDLATTNLR